MSAHHAALIRALGRVRGPRSEWGETKSAVASAARESRLDETLRETLIITVLDMKADVTHILEEHGIQPTAQRVAVAEYVLQTTEHPSADRVWAGVQESFPTVSRATVYNTLNLFVEKGLLRELHLAPDSVLFDPNTDRHHHLIDESTGRIYDIPWNQIRVSGDEPLPDFEVTDYQVVMRGRRRQARG